VGRPSLKGAGCGVRHPRVGWSWVGGSGREQQFYKKKNAVTRGAVFGGRDHA